MVNSLSQSPRDRDRRWLLRTAYDLAASDDAWLAGLTRAAAELVGDGDGAVGYRYRVISARRVETSPIATSEASLDEVARLIRRLLAKLDPERIALSYLGGFHAATLSELVRQHSTYADIRDDGDMRLHAHPMGVQDFSMSRIEGLGAGPRMMFVSPRARPAQLRRDRKRTWARFSAHAAAAWRLRRMLASGTDPSAHAAAVLGRDGAVHHVAHGVRTARSHLERLRRIARSVVEAERHLEHSDVAAGLDAWDALFDGRYSAFDQFDRDGRRFILLVENRPAVTGPLTLSGTERAVAQAAARGHTTSLIAYELGIHESTVRVHLGRALEKLGLGGRDQLIRLGQALLARVEPLDGDVEAKLWVAADEGPDPALLDTLTDAEREVARRIVAGGTNAAIARARGVSERTVAKQVASILEKTDSPDRAALIARLVARGPL